MQIAKMHLAVHQHSLWKRQAVVVIIAHQSIRLGGLGVGVCLVPAPARDIEAGRQPPLPSGRNTRHRTTAAKSHMAVWRHVEIKFFTTRIRPLLTDPGSAGWYFHRLQPKSDWQDPPPPGGMGCQVSPRPGKCSSTSRRYGNENFNVLVTHFFRLILHRTKKPNFPGICELIEEKLSMSLLLPLFQLGLKTNPQGGGPLDISMVGFVLAHSTLPPGSGYP